MSQIYRQEILIYTTLSGVVDFLFICDSEYTNMCVCTSNNVIWALLTLASLKFLYTAAHSDCIIAVRTLHLLNVFFCNFKNLVRQQYLLHDHIILITNIKTMANGSDVETTKNKLNKRFKQK